MNTATRDNQAELRRGWCPTAFRPMAAADGMLLRVRPPQARLNADALAALARIADEYADASILLTRRGKVELRGVRHTAATASALAQASLLEDDTQAALPDRILSPASDIDVFADADAAAMARAIDAELAGAATPPSDKFALAIDGGGLSHIGDFAADVRMDAVPGSPGAWRLALAGDRADATPIGCITESQAPAAVAAVLADFAGTAEQTRMRELSPEALRTRFQPCLPRNAHLTAPTIPREAPSAPPGVYANGWLIAGFAFGRVSSAMLSTLANLARDSGIGGIRITPDRTIILARSDDTASRTLHDLGAILSPSDPRHSLAACVGRAGCRRGSTDTRDDALRFAHAIPNLRAAATIRAVHVSGCSKGCAHRAPALITLVGNRGRYDVVLAAAPDAKPSLRAVAPDTLAQHLAHLDAAFAARKHENESAEAFLGRLGRTELRTLIEPETTQ